MIKIKIKLVGLFKTDNFQQKTCYYPDGTQVQSVIVDLQLPLRHLGIVLINGIHADADSILAEGDELTLLPLLDGG